MARIEQGQNIGNRRPGGAATTVPKPEAAIFVLPYILPS